MIAGLVLLLAFALYVLAILKGKTKPVRVSWFIWIVVALMLTRSYYEVGGADAIWVSAAYLLGTVVIAILSIWYGKKDRTIGDKLVDAICILGCIVSLALWLKTGSAVVGHFAILAVDVAGAIPTILSVRKDPEDEDVSAWLTSVGANTLNLFAVPTMGLVHMAYPIYSLVMVCVVAYYSLRRNIAATRVSPD